MPRINVANIELLGIPGTEVISVNEELRGYNDTKISDGFVKFTWYADGGPYKIKEQITYPMWRVLELVETVEEE